MKAREEKMPRLFAKFLNVERAVNVNLRGLGYGG